MNEARRKAFAEFEGWKDVHVTRFGELRGFHEGVLIGSANTEESEFRQEVPTYDNETDLFRLIRKMTVTQRTEFVNYLSDIVNDRQPFYAWSVSEMFKATTDQLQEAIAKAIGAE